LYLEICCNIEESSIGADVAPVLTPQTSIYILSTLNIEPRTVKASLISLWPTFLCSLNAPFVISFSVAFKGATFLLTAAT
jgi:hypothetical protein